MTRLTTFIDTVELANTDTLLQVTDIVPDDVEVFVQYEADTNLTNEASALFRKDEFKALIEVLYTKYCLGAPVADSFRNFDA